MPSYCTSKGTPRVSHALVFPALPDAVLLDVRLDIVLAPSAFTFSAGFGDVLDICGITINNRPLLRPVIPSMFAVYVDPLPDVVAIGTTLIGI